jgi:hypothetical protein
MDKDDMKRFVKNAFNEAFERHLNEWHRLEARVEACEKEARVATRSLELLKLALEALAGIRRHDPNQFELPGIIDRE